MQTQVKKYIFRKVIEIVSLGH